MPSFSPFALGWHPDLPDPRDYTPAHDAVARLLRALKRPKSARSALPTTGKSFLAASFPCVFGLPASSWFPFG